MMQSGDARQQAWGKWYAGRDRLHALVPELRQVLAQRLFDTSTPGAAALDVALDGLIELKQPPPAGMLSMIFQLLVNAKRLPSDEASRAPEIDLEVIDWRR